MSPIPCISFTLELFSTPKSLWFGETGKINLVRQAKDWTDRKLTIKYKFNVETLRWKQLEFSCELLITLPLWKIKVGTRQHFNLPKYIVDYFQENWAFRGLMGVVFWARFTELTRYLYTLKKLQATIPTKKTRLTGSKHVVNNVAHCIRKLKYQAFIQNQV